MHLSTIVRVGVDIYYIVIINVLSAMKYKSGVFVLYKASLSSSNKCM